MELTDFQWEPETINTAIIVCRDCDATITWIEQYIYRVDELYAVDVLYVVNARKSSNNYHMVCRCNATLGTIGDDGIVRLDNVAERYIGLENAPDRYYLNVKIEVDVYPEVYACFNCMQPICFPSEHIEHAGLGLMVAKHWVANVKYDTRKASVLRCVCGVKMGRNVHAHYAVLTNLIRQLPIQVNDDNFIVVGRRNRDGLNNDSDSGVDG